VTENRALRRPPAARWTKSHELGTAASQTGTRLAGSLNREGGGTTHPTPGGGCWVMARADAVAEDTGAGDLAV
jgi:hypothetical protein